MKKVLVLWYSQTGQLTAVVKSVCSGMNKKDVEFTFEQLQPENDYNFPWSADEFLDVFPETVHQEGIKMKSLQVQNSDFDLIIFGYQPWYLSPSLPACSFLQSEEAKRILNGKPVITVIACRNMWISGQEKAKAYIKAAGGNLVGNIALFDKSHNLVSLVTIIGWLMKGKKSSYWGFLPASGVSEADIRGASAYGEIIYKYLSGNQLENLQDSLVKAGAVEIKQPLMTMEMTGSKIFKIWAKAISKLGRSGNPKRKAALSFFLYYLIFVIIIGTPIMFVIANIKRLLLWGPMKKKVAYFSGVK
ncbi:hypothetical protein MYP_4254 [Sporocytophaga myxococcoides]|uniref:Dialkylrecorsinol condensing enzyme DarA n=1 Tax=Sporocytophaga myxococcoides TaxID=153721 RepID=A0A098LKL1_9BACT|nr:hypothetical protein [Sporocytophaga myxococcoides]GAL87024.1 hypothetical protein MYP_4254 [Sporocytophaga myxococcoides]